VRNGNLLKIPVSEMDEKEIWIDKNIKRGRWSKIDN
jgi:hypothetical protein